MGPRAGWLAGAEARAKAEEARAEARASDEAMVLAETEVLLWCLPVPPSCFMFVHV